jgi:hypothetical protein
MVNKKFVVKLSGEERERLREVISRGKAKASGTVALALTGIDPPVLTRMEPLN